MIVEINKEYDEITYEMQEFLNGKDLEIIQERGKFKVIPYVPPVAQQISELQNKLDNDYRYKKRIDGEYSDEEWEQIATERRTWRQNIRDLMKLKKEKNNVG